MDPRILALVGGDLFYANQLVATLAHMWETAWAQGRLLPGGDAAPAPGPLTPTAPEPAAAVEEPTATVQTLEPAPQGQPPETGGTRRPRRGAWRRSARLLDLVGGDLQRLEELVDTLAGIWARLGLPQPEGVT